MVFYLAMLGVFTLLTTVLIATGIGIGFGLQALFPELGLGNAAIIGTIAPTIVIYFLSKLLETMGYIAEDEYENFMFDEMLDSMQMKSHKGTRSKRNR